MEVVVLAVPSRPRFASWAKGPIRCLNTNSLYQNY